MNSALCAGCWGESRVQAAHSPDTELLGSTPSTKGILYPKALETLS